MELWVTDDNASETTRLPWCLLTLVPTYIRDSRLKTFVEAWLVGIE